MSTRGTSAWLANRKVRKPGGGVLPCCWDTCDKDGSTLYRVITHEHAPGASCAEHDSRYVFCSERHKLYWLHSSGQRARELEARYGGRIYGMLPPGQRSTL